MAEQKKCFEEKERELTHTSGKKMAERGNRF